MDVGMDVEYGYYGCWNTIWGGKLTSERWIRWQRFERKLEAFRGEDIQFSEIFARNPRETIRNLRKSMKIHELIIFPRPSFHGPTFVSVAVAATRTTVRGKTALCIACEKGFSEVVRCLLDAGADARVAEKGMAKKGG